MKNLLLISTILTAAVLAGCIAKEKTPAADATSASVAGQANSNESTEKTVKYLSKDNQIFTLKTTDNFETATLEDSQGNSYALKNGHAASGILLKDENGVFIHSKGAEGIISLVKHTQFHVKEIQ